MEITLEDIQQAANRLSFKERAALAHALLKGLHEADDTEDLDTIWADEVEKRDEAYRSGLISSSPADEVIERVRSRINK